MIKKLAIGVVGLVIIGGSAWAGGQYFGAAQDPAASEEEEDKLILRRPGAGGGTKAGEREGGDDGEPMVSNDAVASTGAVALPVLRPGLWEVSRTDDTGTLKSQVCMDLAIQSEVNVYGTQLHAPFCPARSTVSREGRGRWTYGTRCPLPMNSSLTVSGEIEGDFNRRYSHKVTMVTVSPAGGETTTTTEVGRYLGRCPTGVAGGDILMNGVKMMNLRDAMALGQVMAPGAFGGAPE